MLDIPVSLVLEYDGKWKRHRCGNVHVARFFKDRLSLRSQEGQNLLMYNRQDFTRNHVRLLLSLSLSHPVDWTREWVQTVDPRDKGQQAYLPRYDEFVYRF